MPGNELSFFYSSIWFLIFNFTSLLTNLWFDVYLVQTKRIKKLQTQFTLVFLFNIIFDTFSIANYANRMKWMDGWMHIAYAMHASVWTQQIPFSCLSINQIVSRIKLNFQIPQQNEHSLLDWRTVIMYGEKFDLISVLQISLAFFDYFVVQKKWFCFLGICFFFFIV